ncbi:hypothetical protein PIB30_064886 [Stylosanthes scabra]|uniref:Uncharacterized protein n=1 Tax=Stylosanthes scabra TaxID=79078 RepID=A0ABU6VKA9_9FABA|nr:hypothetical protein [Stylosanthes scabra]
MVTITVTDHGLRHCWGRGNAVGVMVRHWAKVVPHPEAAALARDGVWFQSISPVVFQHADISTMSELVAVFLYNLGGRFTEIRKVGYRYLQRQPNGRFVHVLVRLFNDEHVRVTFGCHRRLMPNTSWIFWLRLAATQLARLLRRHQSE